MKITKNRLRKMVQEELSHNIRESVTISQDNQRIQASSTAEGKITIRGPSGVRKYELRSASPIGDVIIAIRDMTVNRQGNIDIQADALKSVFGRKAVVQSDVLRGKPVRERGQKQIVQGYNTRGDFTLQDENDPDKFITFVKV